MNSHANLFKKSVQKILAETSTLQDVNVNVTGQNHKSQ